MMRLDEDALSLHLEVALAGTSRGLLDDLGNIDRHRHNQAVTALARQLADRLRCFDFQFTDEERPSAAQPALFLDMGPIG